MKIGFDAKRIFHNSTGLGNYSRSLVGEMAALYTQHEYYLFSPSIPVSRHMKFQQEPFRVLTASGGQLWRQFGIRKDINQAGIDIYHGLSNELPRKRSGAKYVVTIHDLIFLRFPEFYPLVDRVFYREKFKRACVGADHIIAVSECTKCDIVKYFNIDPRKITVVYQACSRIYYEQSYGDVEKENYGLFVSSVTERKNLRVVVEAMNTMPKDDRMVVKVVGGGSKHKMELMELINSYGLESHFQFLADVDDERLLRLYKAAQFTIYPSLYEGYGIPIQESLLSGTPVITSNISSMPEAGMGLATLVDPHSMEEVKVAMLRHYENSHRITEGEISAMKRKVNPAKQLGEVMTIYEKLLND